MEQIIANEMEKRNLNAQELAKEINVSPSVISKFLNKQSEITFQNMISIAQFLFPDPLDEVNFMKKYIMTCEKPENIRVGMEFTARHEVTDLLLVLIRKAETSNNSLAKEYAELYEQLYQKSIKGKFEDSFLDVYLETNVRNPETKILKNLLLAYFYLDLNQIEMVNRICLYIQKNIHFVKNDYLRNSYRSRKRELMGYVLLHQLKLQEAREILQSTLDSSYINGKTEVFTYHTLALTYYCEDPHKAIDFFNKAADVSEKYKNHAWAALIKGRRIPLVKVHHDMEITEEEITDHEVKAFYLAKNGEVERAKRIFAVIQRSDYTDYYESFCYEGLEALRLLGKSLFCFERRGDRFSAELSRQEILKRFGPDLGLL